MRHIVWDENINLTDIFDVNTLQRIQYSFHKITGIAVGFCDKNGKPLTKHCVAHDFCSKYTKRSKIGEKYCKLCDARACKKIEKTGKKYIYECYNGLVDYVVPITLQGNLIGTIMGGQVLTHKFLEKEVYEKAKKLGINPEEYYEASKNIPILSEEEIKNQAEFLFQFANLLSELACNRYISDKENVEIEREANMKSDFLANMSHEIRTPMNAVIGMAEMALREELPEEARDYINQIKTASNSLLTIINDILDFSKIDSGKMDIHMAQYRPTSVVADIIDIISTRIGDKKIEFIVDYNPEVSDELMGDSDRIKQIIINLANNAVKFTPEGKVTLRVSGRQVDEKQFLLRVSVEDTGIGIKEEDIGKIFESFQQVDSKRNRNIEGTGLGLAISKRLVELMNGHLYVNSEYGKGSRFYFEIPQIMLRNVNAVSIHDKRDIEVGVLSDNKYIIEQLQIDFARLGVKMTRLYDENDLRKILEGNVEFIFVDEPKFCRYVENCIIENADVRFVLMCKFNSKFEFDIDNLSVVKKPIYSYILGQIFNHEDIHIKVDDNLDAFDFIAPDADALFVDDNEINLNVAVGLVRPLQMKTDTALSGKEAIEKIKKKHYDVIFMDHMMPEMDGVETTRIIRESFRDYDDVPIIALTANAMEESRSMLLVEGMNDFIAKPIEIRVIVEKLRQWLPEEKIKPLSDGDKENMSEMFNDDTNNPLRLRELKEKTDLDVDYAMSLLGNEGLFWSVLNDYYNAIEKKTAKIRKFYNNEDWENYKIEVHALKSASKQIGAKELSSLAEFLERSIIEGNFEPAKRETELLLSTYHKYSDLLYPFFKDDEKEESGDKPIISFDDLTRLLDKMHNYVDELDMDGMETVMEEMSKYSFSQGEIAFYNKLKEAVEEYDVDVCRKIIDAWKNC